MHVSSHCLCGEDSDTYQAVMTTVPACVVSFNIFMEIVGAAEQPKITEFIPTSVIWIKRALQTSSALGWSPKGKEKHFVL